MRTETREWISKAEGDYHCAIRERRTRRSTCYDDICFHCQQCIEKYFKARLTEADRQPVPRLRKLFNIAQIFAKSSDAVWACFNDDMLL